MLLYTQISNVHCMGILIRFLRFSFSISIYVVTLNWSVGPDSNRRWPLGRSVMSRVHIAYYVTHRIYRLGINIIPNLTDLSQIFWFNRRKITVANWGNPSHKTTCQQKYINHCTRTSKRYEEVCYRIKFLLVLLHSIANIELRIQPLFVFGKTIVIVFNLTVRGGYHTGTTMRTSVCVRDNILDIVIFMRPFNECD